MNRKINQRELRNASAQVLRDVQAGQTLVVTRNGEPIAELRPIPPRQFVPQGALAAAAAAAATAEPIDVHGFRADLDALVDPFVDA